MNRRIWTYVGAVVFLTLLAGAVCYALRPQVSAQMLTDALLLCGLAVTAELLSVLLPRSASGSIGFIPYFASAIVVPAWPSVLAMLLVKTTAELWWRRSPLKATLNVAAHCL